MEIIKKLDLWYFDVCNHAFMLNIYKTQVLQQLMAHHIMKECNVDRKDVFMDKGTVRAATKVGFNKYAIAYSEKEDVKLVV